MKFVTDATIYIYVLATILSWSLGTATVEDDDVTFCGDDVTRFEGGPALIARGKDFDGNLSCWHIPFKDGEVLALDANYPDCMDPAIFDASANVIGTVKKFVPEKDVVLTKRNTANEDGLSVRAKLISNERVNTPKVKIVGKLLDLEKKKARINVKLPPCPVVAPSATPSQQCVGSGDGLIIPLYVYPEVDANGACSHQQYTKVAQTAALGTKIIAIVNPNNGPNADSDLTANYNACIHFLKASGVEVIGYIHTKDGFPDISGYRATEDIQEDVMTWKTLYEVDGIFIDEVTNRWPDASFDSEEIAKTTYQAILDYILEDVGYGRVVGNPGNPYFESVIDKYYGNSKVIMVVYESGLSNYFPTTTCLDLLWSSSNGSFEPGVWCQFVPSWDGIEPLKSLMDDGTILRDQSAILVYDMDTSGNSNDEEIVTTEQVIDFGRGSNVGWYYIQDNPNSSNPWDAVPSDHILNAQATKVRCT